MADLEGPPAPATRSLSQLDAPEWHGMPNYNDEVRVRLLDCERVFRDERAPLHAFAAAHALLAPVRALPMCGPQRVRVSWLLAMAFAGVEDRLQALEELDDAILAAADLDDQDALADLLDMRGGLNTAALRFQEAHEDYDDAVAMRQSQRLDRQTDDFAMDEARALVQHASTLYLLAQPQEAGAALAQARELARRGRADASVLIAIEYTQAHFDRLFGNPEDALLPALHAASYFSRQGPRHENSAARTHVFSAEVALDMAERTDGADDRAAFLQMARAHVREALRLAERPHKETGDGSLGLARLAEQRLARLTSGAATGAAARQQAIREVLRDAEERQDLMLVAQAHTALADELAAQGHVSEALAHYERAIQVVERTEAPVLALPARRALHRHGEQHPAPIRPDAPGHDGAPPA